jgi:hypothetical protein
MHLRILHFSTFLNKVFFRSSTCRLCQQTQTLNLLVVVQGQCTMGCAADESGMETVFSALKLEPLARGVNPYRKS